MKKILIYLIPILFILTCQANAVTLTQKIGSGYITQTVKPGHEVTLRFVNKPNYEFENWEVESGSVVIDTTNPVITFVMPSTDVVIRGKYQTVEKQYYTITFDSNGGTGVMTAQTIEQGKSNSLSSNNFTRSGYIFKGWATTAGGSVAYTNQASITPSGNITLYAVWQQSQNGTAKLVYNANNGSGAPSEESYTLTGTETSHSFTISSTVPTRSGYTFVGWSEDSSATIASYTAGNTISIGNEIKTLYAVWELNQNGTAKLVYNANNGSGVPSEESYTLTGNETSHSFTISSTTPTRAGYTFVGWSEDSNGITASYTTGNTISIGNETKTLYAVWELNQNGTAKLIYNANSGSGAPTEESYTLTGTETSHSFTISSTTPTRDGYTFKGWAENSGATVASYTAGNTVSVGNETNTLYAVWELNQNGTAKLVYNANSGSGAPSEESYTLTGTETSHSFTISSTTPTRDGYTFKGWAENSGATIASYTAGNTVSVGNETKILYAVWKEDIVLIADAVSVGDYITYMPSSTSYTVTTGSSGHSSTQTYNPSSVTNWRIFSNSNGEVKIISTESVGNLTLYGWDGINSIVQKLNNFANAYINSNYATSARSLGYDETYVSDSYTNSDTRYYADYTYLRNNTTLSHTAGNVWLPSSYENEDESTYAIDLYCMTPNCGVNRINFWVYDYDFGEGWESGGTCGVRPVITLKSTLKIIGGSGAVDDPWQIRNFSLAELVYDVNGGNGMSFNDIYEFVDDETNHSFTISAIIPTRAGYTFKGWAESSSAITASYTSGDTINVGNEPKTLYAVWEEQPILNATVSIGDYITYVPSSTSYIDSNVNSYNPATTTSWRVFSNDGTNVEIISTNSIGDFHMQGKTRYIEAVQKLQDLSSAYVNSDYAISGRSLGYSEVGLTSSQVTNYKKINTSTYPLAKNISGFPYIDEQYVNDVNTLNNYSLHTNDIIWLASRSLSSGIYASHFSVRTVSSDGTVSSGWSIYSLVDTEEGEKSEGYSNGVRPIIKLKSTVKITGGSGTSSDPYQIVAE